MAELKKRTLILGAGGHARVLVEMLAEMNATPVGCFCSEPPSEQWPKEIPWFGTDDRLPDYDPDSYDLVNGIGGAGTVATRRKVFLRCKELRFDFLTLIHPSAIVSRKTHLGEGAQVMAGVVLQPYAQLGDNVIVNTGSCVDHDCCIGAHSHIAPGVCMSGGVETGEAVHIGTGAAIRNGIKIGDEVIIGVGSVVVADIDDNLCVVGSPARPIVKSD